MRVGIVNIFSTFLPVNSSFLYFNVVARVSLTTKMLPSSLLEASYTLGKGRLTTLFKVLLPNIRTSLITGSILSFAHTVGEFGVVLMVGGNIPHKTRVVSIALYDEVESMNYAKANVYAMILLLFAFLTLLIVYLVNFRSKVNQPI